jgi:hypothetical protein
LICGSVFFAYGRGWRALKYFLDPNEPLLTKIEIVSASLIVALIYSFFMRRKP